MPQTPPPVSPNMMNIGYLYHILFRHKRKIIAFSALGAVASILVYFLTPGAYESEARLLVRYVSDTTVLDTMATGERITAPGRGGENVINSEIAILSSRDLVEKVIAEMGSGLFSSDSTNELDRARLAVRLMSAIRIQAPKNSNVIQIAFNAATPALAQEFLRRLTEAYLQKHNEIHREAGAYEFLSKQTDQLRSRLSETEDELRKLKYSEGIVSIAEAKKNASQRAENLTRDLDELEATLTAAKARAGIFRSSSSTSAGGRTSTVSTAAAYLPPNTDLNNRLARLRQRESELLASFTSNSIPVQEVHEQIVELQELMKGGRSTSTGSTNNAVSKSQALDFAQAPLEDQMNIAALEAKIAFQKELLQRVHAEAKKIDLVEARIVQLERGKELQEANLKYFSQSLEHARVDEALSSGRMSNIGIIQPATLPVEKMRPKLAQFMGLALLAGIALGLGLSVLQEHFIDHSIWRPAELMEIMKVPLVMSIPELPAGRSISGTGAAKDETQPPGTPGDEGQKATEENFELWDTYDALRDRLMTVIGSDPAAKPHIIGVTGCAQGSGVSTIATGLALSLARNGVERVALIDANTESVSTTIFVVNPATGSVELVPDKEGDKAAKPRNRDTKPADKGEPGSVYVTSAQRLTAVIQRLRNSPPVFAIVDLPPVTEAGLTRRVGRLLDGVLLVVAAEEIDRHVAEHARDWLLQSNVKIIGSILNKRRKYVPDWLYSTC